MRMPSGSQGPSGPFATAVAAEVRAVMGRHWISGTQLAGRIGVSQTYLSKRLRNDAAFTLNDLSAICEALNEDVFQLIATARDRL